MQSNGERERDYRAEQARAEPSELVNDSATRFTTRVQTHMHAYINAQISIDTIRSRMFVKTK